MGYPWKYRWKYNADGSIDKPKSRLAQVEGVDFHESFSPVAKWSTIRVLIHLATFQKWELHQVDVSNAFLHGYLPEEIFMKPPKEYTKAGPGQVCKLNRSLYGLKQASREWNVEFSTHLLSYGCTQFPHDHCFFTRNANNVFLAVLVYVDDVLITGSSLVAIQDIKSSLYQKFTIKDMGAVHYFLGIEIHKTSAGTYLSQGKYIHDLLGEVGLLGIKPIDVPLPPGTSFATSEGDLLHNPDKYRSLVGKLLYLNFTRPDLSFAVNHLS